MCRFVPSIFIILTICLSPLFCVQALANKIAAIKENKAVVMDPEESLNKGDKVVVVDKNFAQVGQGVIVKRRGPKALFRLEDGEMKKGFQVVTLEQFNTESQGRKPSGVSDSSTMGLVIYGGLYNSVLKPSPIAFGLDFKYLLSDDPIVIRFGGMYWSHSSNGLSFSLTEFSGGVGWQLILLEDLSLEPGARLGYATINASLSASGNSFNASASAIALTPYIGCLYHYSPGFGFGGEVRVVDYISGSGNAIGDNYFLAQVFIGF